MSNASNYLEQAILDHIFRTATFNKPDSLWIGLTSTVLTDTEVSDVSGREVANAGNYARKQLNAGNSNWDAVDQVNGSGHTQNTSAVEFNIASADWGWVSGMFIADSGTWGTGNILFYGGVATPKLVGNGDQIKANAGSIDIYLA